MGATSFVGPFVNARHILSLGDTLIKKEKVKKQKSKKEEEKNTKKKKKRIKKLKNETEKGVHGRGGRNFCQHSIPQRGNKRQ